MQRVCCIKDDAFFEECARSQILSPCSKQALNPGIVIMVVILRIVIMVVLVIMVYSIL